MASFDSSIRLRQLNNSEVSGYVVDVIENYLTGNVPLPTGALSGIFYPLNQNPSSYITSGQTGIFLTQQNLNSLYYQLVTYVGQNYYAIGNPNSYITTGNTGNFVTLNQTGAFASVVNLSTTGNTLNSLINLFSGIVIENYITTGQTGQFYPANNPSGFIIPSQTGAFYASNNPLSYIRSGSNAVLNSLLISGIDNAFYSFSITTGNVNPNSQSSIINNSVFNIDNLGNVYLLPSGIIEFSDVGGIAFIDGNMVLSDNYNEGVLLSQITGLSTGLQTEINNLSGTLTGNYVKLSQTGNFYASNNPAGYITGLNTGNFVTTGQTGSFGSNTGSLTGIFYPLTGNPAGYITGLNTGSFISTSQTGNFATTGNLNSASGYLNSLIATISEELITDYAQLNNSNTFKNTNTFSGSIFLIGNPTNNQFILQNNSAISNGLLYDTSSLGSVDWVDRYLYDNQPFLSLDWQNRYLYDFNQTKSIDYNNRILYDDNPIPSIYYNTRILTGNWTSTGLFNSSGLQVQGNNVVTGGPYYLNSNPSGFITGLNTGSFITVNQTGNFVTTGQTGSFGANTGQLTGVFYPLTGNPSGYITTGQTGQFYASNNPAGYITGFNSGNYVQTGQTGNFYPANNPSGYIGILPTTTGYTFGSYTINWSGNNNFLYSPTGNTNFIFTGCSQGQTIVVGVHNTGNAIVSFPSGTTGVPPGNSFRWPGSAPTGSLSGYYDVYTFLNLSNIIFGNVILGF